MSVDDQLEPYRVFLHDNIIMVDSENSIIEAIAGKDDIILACALMGRSYSTTSKY